MRYEKFIRDWKTALAENFFLRSLSLLMGVALILNVSVFRARERIILTPPAVEKQFWVEKNRASPAYLEQMAVFFAILGGNLSPANASYNVSAFFNYIVPENLGTVKADLASQAHYITKNNITQAFFPSAINVNEDENSVKVEGEVIRNIGTVRISREKMVFQMRFKVNNFKLYLEEFYADYPERVKSKHEAKEKPREEIKKKPKPRGDEL